MTLLSLFLSVGFCQIPPRLLLGFPEADLGRKNGTFEGGWPLLKGVYW